MVDGGQIRLTPMAERMKVVDIAGDVVLSIVTLYFVTELFSVQIGAHDKSL